MSKNYFVGALGSYKRKNLYQTGIETDRPNLKYAIECPDGSKIFPPTIWRWSKETFLEAKKAGKIDFVKDRKGKWQVFTKMYLYDQSGEEYKIKPRSLLLDAGLTKDGNDDIKKIFGKTKPFNYPKPVRLIKYLIEIVSNKEDTVLDSFAGSGTTAQAVLLLNRESGNRKFILVELEDSVAKTVTAERVKRFAKSEKLDIGFEFCELDKPLFDSEGQIEEECSFEQLAQYIFFTETQTNVDKKQISGNFVGAFSGTDYYLIFREKGVNVLDRAFLKKLNRVSSKKVIYADKCLIDEEDLAKKNIVFKQIPYEVKVY